MKQTFQKGLKTFKDLLHMQNFKKSEQIIKSLLLMVFLPLHVILFISVSVFYLIERLFAFGFRYFITLQAKMFQNKAVTKVNYRKFYTIFSVLIFIVFLPIILVYYLSMLFKFILKQLIKKIIRFLDFSNKIPDLNYLIFDDMNTQAGSMQMSGMMKDLSNTSAIGSAFEQMMNAQNNALNDQDIDKQ